MSVHGQEGTMNPQRRELEWDPEHECWVEKPRDAGIVFSDELVARWGQMRDEQAQDD